MGEKEIEKIFLVTFSYLLTGQIYSQKTAGLFRILVHYWLFSMQIFQITSV